MALYGGVLGDAMTDAANAYLKAVVDAPKEREEQRKRELENRRLESQVKLDEARAAYEARRTSPGYQSKRIVKDKAGNVWQVDMDTESTSLLVEAPTTEAKLKEQRERAIHQAMERVIGKPMFLPDGTLNWEPKDFTDDRIIMYWELLGQGRSQFGTLPGNEGDVVPKQRLLQYPKPRGGTGETQGTGGATQGTGGTTGTTGTGGGTTGTGTSDTTTGTPQGPAPTQKDPLEGSKLASTPEVQQQINDAIEYYAPMYGVRPELMKAMARKESNYDVRAVSGKGAQGVMQLMSGTQRMYGIKDPYDIKVNVWGGIRYFKEMLDRYHGDEELAIAAYNAGPGAVDAALKAGRRIPQNDETPGHVAAIGTWAGGYRGGPKDPKAGPTTVTTSGTPKAPETPRTSTPASDTRFPDKPATPLPKPTPPPEPPTEGRERNVPLTKEQQEKHAFTRWEKLRQWETSEQQRLEAERQQAEREYQHELDKMGGRPTKDQERVTNKLFVNKDPDVTADNYLQLSAVGKKKVNDIIRAPIIRKEEQGWKKLADPHLQELEALKMTQVLTERILPLIKTENLGGQGKIQQLILTGKSYLPAYRSQFEKKAEETLKGMGKEITEANVQAQVAAMVEANGPEGVEIRNRMRGISSRGRLQALSSILMYAHALAQKRLTGGTQRGIIKTDMEEAEKLFNPDLFFTDPDTLFARLQELQGFIQSARSNIEEKVRSYHFDPHTKKYQPAEMDQPVDDDASELEKIREIVRPKGTP